MRALSSSTLLIGEHMMIVIEQERLSAAISLARKVVAKHFSRPVLSNLLVEADQATQAVKLTGFDESTTLTLSVPAEVSASVGVCLPAKLLGDIISRLEGQITLEMGEDHTMGIVCGASRYEVRGLSADQFPVLPDVEGDPFNLSVEVLSAGIETTLPFMSDDATKRVINGVNLAAHDREIQIAATDGHRLSVRAAACDTDNVEVTIPGDALSLLNTYLKTCEPSESVSIALDDIQCRFEVGDFRMIARILDGQYPSYEKLIPTAFQTKQVIPRQAVLDSLNRLAAVSAMVNHMIRINLEPGKMILSSDARESGNGKEVVPLEEGGAPLEPMVIGFNSQYLAQALKVTPGDQVLFCYNTPTKPVVITPLSGGQTNLIMPVQIRSF
jgi:DNA polymerase-3 subunit beta